MSTLVAFNNPDQYIQCVAPFLEANEVENGLFMGILDAMKSNPARPLPPVMIQVKEGDETMGAAFRSDRYFLVTRNLEGSCEDIANHLREADVDLPGVAGPSSSAERFAEAWSKIRGCDSRLVVDQGLHWLKTIDWPTLAEGKMRPMTAHDIPLVARWILAFQKEAVPFEAGSMEDALKNAEARPQRNMTFIWEVHGSPAAMAALARPSRNGITINAVYTTPELRGRGYATSLVAFLSDEGLKRGKEFCSLYTDLSNPTSNAIYQKIGYRPHSNARVYLFR